MIVEEPVVEDLGLVPDHVSIPEIERLIFPGVPYLVSVHRVTEATFEHREYRTPHVHLDKDEVNLIPSARLTTFDSGQRWVRPSTSWARWLQSTSLQASSTLPTFCRAVGS